MRHPSPPGLTFTSLPAAWPGRAGLEASSGRDDARGGRPALPMSIVCPYRLRIDVDALCPGRHVVYRADPAAGRTGDHRPRAEPSAGSARPHAAGPGARRRSRVEVSRCNPAAAAYGGGVRTWRPTLTTLAARGGFAHHHHLGVTAAARPHTGPTKAGRSKPEPPPRPGYDPARRA